MHFKFLKTIKGMGSYEDSNVFYIYFKYAIILLKTYCKFRSNYAFEFDQDHYFHVF